MTRNLDGGDAADKGPMVGCDSDLRPMSPLGASAILSLALTWDFPFDARVLPHNH